MNKVTSRNFFTILINSPCHQLHDPIDGKELIASYYMMNGAETAAMFTGIERGLRRPVERNDMELMTWGIHIQ
jgi:hypothetical protein